jgi:hypothetical protein
MQVGASGSPSYGLIVFLNKLVIYYNGQYATTAKAGYCNFKYLNPMTAFSCYLHGSVGLGFSAGSRFEVYGR